MEAMAFEDLIAAIWQEKGLAVCTRHPVRVEKGYSDRDVLAVRGNGDVGIAEIKLRGRPRDVYCYAGDYDFVNGWPHDEAGEKKGWTGFVSNLSRLWDLDTGDGRDDPRVRERAMCGAIRRHPPRRQLHPYAQVRLSPGSTR